MKKILIFMLLSQLFGATVIAQSYHLSLDSLQQNSFKRSDIVVLGEVIELDTVNLVSRFRVYEIFKGSPSQEILFKITTGSSYIPSSNGLWIIYASKVADNTYSLDDNDISRSNINPDKIRYYLLPPARTKKELLEFDFLRLNIKLKALAEWENELYRLRNK